MKNITRRNALKYAALGAISVSPVGKLLVSETHAQALSDKKVLVLFYSRTDITGTLARQLHGIVGGDITQVEPVTPYPENYNATTAQAKREQETNFRPPFKPIGVDVNSYDVIFFGYPNWWGTIPMPLFTFLERHNLAGKTVAPFSTHEGSHLGSSVRDIRRLCPNATVLDGYAVRGRMPDPRARQELTNWIQRIRLG